MKTRWGSGGIAPPFLTSALDGVSAPLHASAALPPGKEPTVSTGCEDVWSPQTGFGAMQWRKSFAPAGNGTPAVHPVPRRYSDCAIDIF
jgi:hypothetical protein